MPLKESIYKVAEHQRDRILHRGYKYEGNIFKNTMSNFMFRDPVRSSILTYMEKVVFELIERVKQIKSHVNYVVDKNSRYKN